MLPTNSQYLARSKSNGPEKRAPPPIKPKPSMFASPPAEAPSTRASITVTDSSTPSASFGDLKKAFERQPNSSPLFSNSDHPRSSFGQNNSANASRAHLGPTLGVPSPNNRPRSLSTPAPPVRDEDEDASSNTLPEGVDNRQPDFGNLRARFQSQASLSSVSLSKPDPPKLQRAKPAAPTPPKPTAHVFSPPQQPRMSLDSAGTHPRFPPPQQPKFIPPSPSASRLSSGSVKQPPRPPPMKPAFAAKTPTPPRTPPPRIETPESERNPFMGSSEEDEPGSKVDLRSTPNRTGSKIQSNPVFQQLNNKPILAGKVAPPPPQRPAPRPVSPHGAPPKLPSRSSSTIIEDTPEEAERKHRLDKRRRVVQELLETEISYSKDMLLLQEVYVADMADSHLFTPADEKIIFTNLADVISLTLDFIALLTPACGGIDQPYDDEATFVGEAFIQMMSRIRRVYSEYCKRQEASAQYLQELDNRKDLKPFFELCTEKCKGKTTGWDLASLLIKPVQRVLKYPLLINQIHALTPSEHNDYENLATVQKDMLLVAEEINEIKKRKDIVEKIVGSKKKTDSDIVHGFNKKFARTTQQLRQAVGGSNVTVDILFEALLEKFNLQQRLVREFAKHIQNWLVSIKQFFDTQEAIALTLMEIYSMSPLHRNDENHSHIVVSEYHKSISQFSKTIGRELENRLKKTVYRSIENFLRLFSGPLQVMKKREKKLLDYDNVQGMKERGDTIDKHMLESASAYTAINEQLVDELPKFLGLTTQYFDVIVMEFSRVQSFFYEQVKIKVQEYFVEHMDPTAAKDLDEYVERMDVFEDYVEAMERYDGPIARISAISLLRNVESNHEMAFQSMRDSIQRRRQRVGSQSQSRSRSSSNAMSPVPPGQSSWQSKPMGSSSSSSRVSPPPSLQAPLQPEPYESSRFYPGEDENPFEMPESIFHDGSVASSEDYEPFQRYTVHDSPGRNRGSARPISSASSLSYHSVDHQAKEQTRLLPALDDGMDADEIGLAQALFECTAIYPYQSTEDRQLNFEAGESIIVFGLNEDGWYFGKKVGKETTGWFPASHCIQI